MKMGEDLYIRARLTGHLAYCAYRNSVQLPSPKFNIVTFHFVRLTLTSVSSFIFLNVVTV